MKRAVLFRTLAAILTALMVWAFLRAPGHFLQSLGGWQNRLGLPFLAAAFGAYALFGEGPAHRILGLLTKAIALPMRLLERLIGRVVALPLDLSQGPPDSRTPPLQPPAPPPPNPPSRP